MRRRGRSGCCSGLASSCKRSRPSSRTTPSSRSRSRPCRSPRSASTRPMPRPRASALSLISAPWSPAEMLPRQKLEGLARRHAELEQLLCEPAVLADVKRMNSLNRERGQLTPLVESFGRYRALERNIADDREALNDPELGELARE